jgi:hypothetical protein
MIYTIIYNPKDEESRHLFRQRIMSMFSTGISVKKDVYLVAVDNDRTPVNQFKEIVQRCASRGDSVIVAPVAKGIGVKGYPEDLRQWLEANI